MTHVRFGHNDPQLMPLFENMLAPRFRKHAEPGYLRRDWRERQDAIAYNPPQKDANGHPAMSIHWREGDLNRATVVSASDAPRGTHQVDITSYVWTEPAETTAPKINVLAQRLVALLSPLLKTPPAAKNTGGNGGLVYSKTMDSVPVAELNTRKGKDRVTWGAIQAKLHAFDWQASAQSSRLIPAPEKTGGL